MIDIQENISLKSWNTFRIEAIARYFTKVVTIDQMQQAFSWCRKKNIPFFILGKGSNSLFTDRGFSGLVILNKIDFFEDLGKGYFSVGSGFSFPRLGTKTADRGWTGLEFAAGIPASVGGALFMNAGAGKNEVCDVLHSADYLHTSGELESFNCERLEFRYRTSLFQEMEGGIVGAIFQLTPSLKAKENLHELLSYRLKSQPYDLPSAGCVFRNPEGESCSAGALIEQCGLKGKQIGKAQVSKKHANFIVNVGGAKSIEIQELIKYVQNTIFSKTGILLACEIRQVPQNEKKHVSS